MSQSSETSQPAPATEPPLPGLIVAGYGAVLGSVFPLMTIMTIGDIGGGLAVGPGGGAVINTMQSVGSVSGILLSPLFAAGIGRGRTMFWFGLGFLLAAVGAGVAPDYGWMLVARFAQGFFGGALPLLFMLLVMTSLTSGKGQFEGMALFAASTTALVGLTATLGGSIFGAFGWRGLFWVQAVAALPYCIGAAFVLRREHGRPGFLRGSDWPGLVLLSTGLSLILFAVSEGERHFWTVAWWVPAFLAGGAICLAFGLWTMRSSARPLLVLAVFRRATFSWAIALSIFFRFGSLLVIFIVPQYLGHLQGYRPADTGHVLITMVPATILSLLLAYVALHRVDTRAILSAGLGCFAVAAWSCTRLGPDWAVDQLRQTAIIVGLGMGFFQVAVLRFAVIGVTMPEGPTVGTIFNLARVFGVAFGLAILSHLVVEREKYHSAELVRDLSATDPNTALRLATATRRLRGITIDPATLHGRANASLAHAASAQAFTLAFADCFAVVAVVLFVGAILVWVLPGLPPERLVPSSSVRRYS